MSFVHDDLEFAQLIAIVAREAGVAEALIEKDSWPVRAWPVTMTTTDLVACVASIRW